MSIILNNSTNFIFLQNSNSIVFPLPSETPSSCVIQWAARCGGTGSDIGYGITSDSSGNVYIVGSYASGSNTFALYNSNGTLFSNLTNVGSNDVFVVKYNSSGTVQWAARCGGTGSDIGYGITSDSSGNVYIVGSYASGSNTFALYNSDGSIFSNLTNAGSNDVFVVKYNSSGTVQWATRYSSIGSDVGRGIDVDSSGNMYVTGSYGNTLSLYNSDGSLFSNLSTIGSDDVFIIKSKIV